MKNADMPAMTSGALYDDAAQDVIPHRGLTKREHFAGLAMAAYRTNNGLCTSQALAAMALSDADALLAELEEE